MPIDPITSTIFAMMINAAIDAANQSAAYAQQNSVEVNTVYSEQNLPPNLFRGTMLPPDNGTVTINGVNYPLAPGVQIRNKQNRIVLPFALQGQGEMPIYYLLNTQGAVFRIWIFPSA